MMAMISKPLAIGILILGLLALTAFGEWRVAVTVQAIIAERVKAAETARDNQWHLEIETANAASARNIIEQMRVSHAADLAAQAEINRLKNQISNLEERNAALPDSDCSGIDHERTRLLNNQPLTDYPH